MRMDQVPRLRKRRPVIKRTGERSTMRSTNKSRLSQVMRRALAFMLAFAISMSGAMVTAAPVYAESMLMITDGTSQINVDPGTFMHVKLPVRSVYHNMDLYSLEVTSDSPLLTITNVKLTDNAGSEVNMRNGASMNTNTNVYIEFDLASDEALKIGKNTISVKGTVIDYDDGSETPTAKSVDLVSINTYTSRELAGAYISVSDVSYSASKFVPDSEGVITLTIKNEGALAALNTFFAIDFGDSGIVPDYNLSSIKLGDLPSNSTVTKSVSVKIPKDVTPGEKKLSISISAKDRSGADLGPFLQSIYVTVAEAKQDKTEPKIKVTSKSNYDTLERNGRYEIPLVIKNTGKKNAKKVTVKSVSGLEAAGFITKDYTGDSILVGTIEPGMKETVNIPIIVGKDATAGLKEFVFAVSYTDVDDKQYADVNITVYRNVTALESTTTDVLVTDVEQSVDAPVAGESFTLSFTVRNVGTSPVSEVKLSGTGFAATGFMPMDGDPYINVGDMAAGTQKRVSMRLMCGEDIPSGTGAVAMNMTYADEAGTKQSETLNLYVLNVQGKGTTTGRPKLIVSYYETDKEVLRASETFLFKFRLKNTHATKPAKNIKLTISEKDNIFSAAHGTNTFFIEEIKAGEEVEQEIELKTKNTAATGDYDLKILVEYEYDNMSDQEKEKGGVSEENLVKLHATENYRPVIENVMVGGWDGSVYVDEPTDMSFEFYNMGQSKLGNVFVTVEGDFELANNANMTYVGAIDAYGQQVVSPQVVCHKEGDAKGTVVVHFEDSNGDEITTEHEFSAYVSMMDMGGDFYEPEIPEGYTMNENGEIVPIDEGLPIWVWIAIGAGVLVVIIIVIVVVRKKSKKKKAPDGGNPEEDEEEDEDY